MPKYCQVIVDIASEDVDHVFTYRIPDAMLLQPGMRVYVPFGRIQRVEGIVIRLEEECDLPPERMKNILSPIEDYPVILPHLLTLAEHIHEESFCTLTQALRLLYPSGMRRSQVREKTQETAVLLVPENEWEHVLEGESRAPKRMMILRSLMSAEAGEIQVSRLRAELGECRPSLLNLCNRGFIRLEKRETARKPYRSLGESLLPDPELTEQQKRVLAELIPSLEAGRGEYLLYGVTGSGKTEVFIRAVRAAAAAGKTSIVLVPEIALTPQMVAWFRSRFGEKAAVLHSRLSAGERYDEWQRIRRGEVQVVIGARSAIFAPVSNLGLIIIDEEHEQSYQSENVPQYDAREIAKFRCGEEKACLLLASATPSLRSYALALRGDMTLLEMPKRIANRPLPTVHIVDMREEMRSGNRSVFSNELASGIENCLKRGKQAILFINRRGYSTFVSCRNCGYVVSCDHCDVSMTYHMSDRKLHCHYCGKEEEPPKVCPECGSPYIRYFGTGTQRVEDETRRLFPGIPCERMDNDTTQTKDAHSAILGRFRRGETRILIGTQMIAKGLDFPDVTLVGIISADAMLHLPDYRADERAFQLLTQVAGRAGRAAAEGEVFLQCYDPENATVQLAARQDYRGFYEREMKRRRVSLYPPYTVIARLLFEADSEDAARENASLAHRALEDFISGRTYLAKYVVALRLMPCPIAKIRDKFRWEVVLKAVDKPVCREILARMSELSGLTMEGCRCICQVRPANMA